MPGRNSGRFVRLVLVLVLAPLAAHGQSVTLCGGVAAHSGATSVACPSDTDLTAAWDADLLAESVLRGSRWVGRAVAQGAACDASWFGGIAPIGQLFRFDYIRSGSHKIHVRNTSRSAALTYSTAIPVGVYGKPVGGPFAFRGFVPVASLVGGFDPTTLPGAAADFVWSVEFYASTIGCDRGTGCDCSWEIWEEP